MKHPFTRKAIVTLLLPAAATMWAVPAVAASSDAAARVQAQDTQRVSSYRAFRASELIGKEVKNPQGKELGEIKDLVVHMSTGDVRYAIMSFGGFMGLGDRMYAVPVKSLKLGAKGNDLVLNMDKARIQQQKSFPRDKWSVLKEKHFWGEVDRLSGLPAVQPADAYYAYSASELIGKDVVNVKGEDVGELEDLVINMNAQQVHYAVLEVDPGLFASEKLYSLPLRAFMFRRDKDDRTDLKTDKLVVNLGKADIAKLRGFDRNRWPDLNDPTYRVDIDRYFVGVFPPVGGTSSDAGYGALFGRLDANNDGVLSRSEAQSNDRVHTMWGALDRNNDGRISRSEFSEHYSTSLHVGGSTR
jgi:sporulation protein YlmC with PRC-barrel domain